MKNGKLKKSVKKVKMEVKGLYYRAKKGKTPMKYLHFTYHLADHCNLNCQCCDHFSPLAEKKLADFESFKKDIQRLGTLCRGECYKINLQGGEPLLHPDAIQFAICARENFPKGMICFQTNGLLLPEQPETFWKACKEYNIEIQVTKYPVAFDYEIVSKKAEACGVQFSYYNDAKIEKTSYLIPLDLQGKQSPLKSYCKCFHAISCIMLKNGRLYPCTIAPNIEHFNKYFHQNLILSDADSIDIYKAKSFEEIAEFLAKPIPFCRYCNVTEREYDLKWEQSKRKITEWVKEDSR